MTDKKRPNADELNVKAMQELLRIVQGKRTTRNNLFGSAIFAKAIADEFQTIPQLEYRSLDAPGPLSVLQVPKLRNVRSDFPSVLDLATRGIPVLWVAEATWVDRQVASGASRDTISEADAVELLASTRESWTSFCNTNTTVNPEFVSMTNLLLEHTKADNYEIALPFAYSLLERVTTFLLQREGITPRRPGQPEIYGRAQRMRSRGVDRTPVTAVPKLRRALAGATIVGLYEREYFEEAQDNVLSGTRHFVVHAIRPSHLQRKFVILTAAAVVSTIYEAYK